MMPELGKYATAVLSSYGITLLLIAVLLGVSLWRGTQARAGLRRAEEETARHGKD